MGQLPRQEREETGPEKILLSLASRPTQVWEPCWVPSALNAVLWEGNPTVHAPCIPNTSLSDTCGSRHGRVHGPQCTPATSCAWMALLGSPAQVSPGRPLPCHPCLLGSLQNQALRQPPAPLCPSAWELHSRHHKSGERPVELQADRRNREVGSLSGVGLTTVLACG